MSHRARSQTAWYFSLFSSILTRKQSGILHSGRFPPQEIYWNRRRTLEHFVREGLDALDQQTLIAMTCQWSHRYDASHHTSTHLCHGICRSSRLESKSSRAYPSSWRYYHSTQTGLLITAFHYVCSAFFAEQPFSSSSSLSHRCRCTEVLIAPGRGPV